jgi:putative two-component system response regulator
MPAVLIVDDDKPSREILMRLLKYYNFEVDSAVNGEDALELAEQKVYDFAILDLALPQMDGWQLLNRLQSQPQTQNLRSVAITAFYDPQVAREARNAGFLACYPKPANSKIIEEIAAMMN